MAADHRFDVALDTNIVRQLGEVEFKEGQPDYVRRWDELRGMRDRFRFLVARTAFDELMITFSKPGEGLNGGWSWEKWKIARSRLMKVVNRDDPFAVEQIPLGKFDASDHDRRINRVADRNIWQALLRIEKFEHLFDITYYDERGLPCYFAEASALETTTRRANAYASFMRKVADRVWSLREELPTLDEFVQHACLPFPEKERQKFALFLRPALFFARMACRNYNAEKNSSNDLYDTTFLQTLLMPAVGISHDFKMIEKAGQMNWPLSKCLFSLDGFIEAANDPARMGEIEETLALAYLATNFTLEEIEEGFAKFGPT